MVGLESFASGRGTFQSIEKYPKDRQGTPLAPRCFQVLSVKKCPHCGKDVLKAPKKSKSKKQNDYGNNNMGPRL